MCLYSSIDDITMYIYIYICNNSNNSNNNNDNSNNSNNSSSSAVKQQPERFPAPPSPIVKAKMHT